ncbi:hypothetical protein ACU4GA_12955 [Methylobacterium oryzae CBMB20]
MNMIVVLTLYPTVFLWGVLVGTPILSGVLKVGFPVALFIGNVFSVLLTAQMVPWTAKRLGWWLTPDPARRTRVHLQGAALLITAYALMILVFWTLF